MEIPLCPVSRLELQWRHVKASADHSFHLPTETCFRRCLMVLFTHSVVADRHICRICKACLSFASEHHPQLGAQKNERAKTYWVGISHIWTNPTIKVSISCSSSHYFPYYITFIVSNLEECAFNTIFHKVLSPSLKRLSVSRISFPRSLLLLKGNAFHLTSINLPK